MRSPYNAHAPPLSSCAVAPGAGYEAVTGERSIASESLDAAHANRFSVLDLLHAAIRVPGEATSFTGVHRIVHVPGPAAETGATVVGDGALDAGAVVHHERTVLGDGLGDRPSLKHEDLALTVAGFEAELAVGFDKRRGVLLQ